MKNANEFLPRSEFLVLCHGAHLQATNWPELVIGDLTAGKAGRASRAIEMALLYGARGIIWATGASEKDGKKEAIYTYDQVLENIGDIHAYLLDCGAIDDSATLADLRGWIVETAIFDVSTQNTTEEVVSAMNTARDYGCRAIVQVSSATHIQRCYAEAVKVNYNLPKDEQIRFIPEWADTCFPDSSPSDVVVSEPPHRGDNLNLWLPRLFRVFFRLMTWDKEMARAVISDVSQVLLKHGIVINPNQVLPPD